MTVSPVGFANGLTGADNPAPKTPQDEFLRMLVAQLEHQDPLAPQDSAQFVAQLAQFTQVEQTAETNQRLGGIAETEASLARSSFANLVGREITAVSDQVVIEDGRLGDASHTLKLDRAAERVEVIVRNTNGDEVTRFELGQLPEGESPLNWDGTTQAGDMVADGTYTFDVRAYDADDEAVDVQVQLSGRATSIDFRDNLILYTVGSAEIGPQQILAIAE